MYIIWQYSIEGLYSVGENDTYLMYLMAILLIEEWEGFKKASNLYC